MRKLLSTNNICKVINMRFICFIWVMFSTTAFSETTTISDFIISDSEEPSAIDERIDEEAKVERSNFSIIPHKPNYLLPVYFNQKLQDTDSKPQRSEVKFQISFKVPLFQSIGNMPISAYVAYTQLSYWQAYNTEYSSPFRETNYEPEAFLVWETDQALGLGWRLKATTFGFAHQSNGKTEPTSRSWNRLEGSLIFDNNNNLVVTVNPWYRLEDSDDDNPGLLDYYGHGQIITAYKYNEHVFSVTSRNNIESSFSKGSVQGSWSFPLYGKVKGYVQVFSGYGNSLIEYDQYTNTVGLGISISDFL